MSLLIIIIARELSIRQKCAQHRLKDVTNVPCACGVCGSLWRSGARVQDADRRRLLDVSKRKLKRSPSTTYNYCYIIIAVYNITQSGEPRRETARGGRCKRKPRRRGVPARNGVLIGTYIIIII